MPQRLTLRACDLRRFPVETPHVSIYAGNPNAKSRGSRSWNPPFSTRCVAKSPSDSAGVGQRLWKTDSATAVTARTANIRIIGIDPGLRRTGWGVDRLRRGEASPSSLAASVVSDDDRKPGLDGFARSSTACRRCWRGLRPRRRPSSRLSSIATPSATLKLGQARGIALLVPALLGAHDRRICAQRGEEDRGRRRPWRQGPDQGHGEMPAAARRVRQRGRGRRARHRHHPCPFARAGGGSKPCVAAERAAP